MLRTKGRAKDRKSLGKNFKGKVAAFKKQHKQDMEEMTELTTVISGAKQTLPEPVDAAASAVVCLNAIIKNHRYS